MPTLPKDLTELIAAKIIDDETAQRIHAYRAARAAQQPNRLPLIFSILGAFLVGLSIILVVAHNWDNLPRVAKIATAYIPVLVSLGLCLRALLLREDSPPAREVGAVILIFAVGACLAMVSQTYHIDGDLYEFLFSWWWLVLPVVYVMRSSMASVLLWVGTAVYGFQTSDTVGMHWIWIFIALLIPYYVWLRHSSRTAFSYLLIHEWVVPIAFVAAFVNLPEFSGRLFNGTLFMSWFALFFMVGNVFFEQKRTGWHIIGWTALIGILTITSFQDFWEHNNVFWSASQDIPFFAWGVVGAIWLFCAAFLAGLWIRKHPLRQHPIPYLAMIAPAYLWMGQIDYAIGMTAANLLLLGIGIYYIWEGNKHLQLKTLNTGLLVISVQMIARFFDTDMSFTLRALLFFVLGMCFFIANRYLLQQQEKAAKTIDHE